MEEVRLEVDGGEGQGKGVRAEGTSLEAPPPTPRPPLSAQGEPRWLTGWLETRLLPVPRGPSQIPAEPRRVLTSSRGMQPCLRAN